MPLEIICGDITKMRVDAIVNAANTALQMGGGVCGAIFRAAGEVELQAACDKLAPIKTGEAVITPAFKLPAIYIIHTAGPVYKDGRQGEEELLRSCYKNALALAKNAGCGSIAFPLISSGIYGYPKAEALQVAISTIADFLKKEEMTVNLVIFDKETYALATEVAAPYIK
ncbi:MAG TPA: macro domain-containing protein [Firmicutes bacterium]|nr:macro domain-containing protein [Bacillota bacterium]